jgi:hypothetical protein
VTCQEVEKADRVKKIRFACTIKASDARKWAETEVNVEEVLEPANM